MDQQRMTLRSAIPKEVREAEKVNKRLGFMFLAGK